VLVVWLAIMAGVAAAAEIAYLVARWLYG